MIFLIINMYKCGKCSSNSSGHGALFNKFKKGYKFALKGNKLIFKKWNDVEGIIDVLKNKKINGIIISGSNYFVKDKEHSIIDDSILNPDIRPLRSLRPLPILAICYGFQYIVSRFGKNSFIKSNKNGYMKYNSSFRITEPFYIPKSKYFFIHTDYIVKVPKDFKVIKKIKNKIIIAYNSKKNILGVQFHPEKYKKYSRLFFNAWINNCVTA
jgi:GMP synthase-like glutamine amidotransferase